VDARTVRCRGARPVALAAALLAAAGGLGCETGPAVTPADLVLTNGKIVTVDSLRPEAEAVAIVGDRIVAVGSSAEIARYIGESTQVIDLEGRLAVPGFIEGHGHFMSLGQARMILDLTRARTWDEIVAMVAAAAREARPGEWIQGRGWHQDKWNPAPAVTVEGVPTHHELSRVSPRNPVILTHASGHASFVNARAMELAGITRSTPNPPGGEIVRDARGEPTGYLRETAQALVWRVFERDRAQRPPEAVAAEARRAVQLAGEELLRKGVTSFHDAGPTSRPSISSGSSRRRTACPSGCT